MSQIYPARLRKLTMKDLDAVTEIDYSLLGAERKRYWEEKIQLTESSAVPSLAAEVDGKMVDRPVVLKAERIISRTAQTLSP